MKTKLLQAALTVLLSVIWLFPFQFRQNEWVLISGAFAAYLCLTLIPQRAAAFACAAAVSVGFSIYRGPFFAAFTPGLAACALFLAAARPGKSVSLKKDGLAFAALLAAGITTAGSLLYTFFSLKGDAFRLPPIDNRHAVFAAAAAVFIALVPVFAGKKTRSAREKKPPFDRTALTTAAAAMLAAMAAAVLLMLKTDVPVPEMDLLPAFMCAFTVLGVPNAAAETLFGKGTDKKGA